MAVFGLECLLHLVRIKRHLPLKVDQLCRLWLVEVSMIDKQILLNIKLFGSDREPFLLLHIRVHLS